MPSLAVLLVPLAAAALIATVLWATPRLTRPDLYFAVTVMPGFRDTAEGLSILRRYRRELAGVSALVLLGIAALASTSGLRLMPVALLFQLGASFGVFYRARRLVLPHSVAPTTIREVEFGGHHRRIPGGWPAACGPFAVLAACAGYLLAHWRQIPARLPVHFGAGGQPDRWAARSLSSVLFPLASAAAVLAIVTLIRYGIARWLRPINAGGPRGTRESQFRTTVSILLLAVEYLVALQSSWIALQPVLPAAHRGPPWGIALLLPLVVVIAITAVLMRLGQGGSRRPAPHPQESAASAPVGDRTEDRFWKLGLFYFNRDDPAIVVEKRFGIGYTINLAHPAAWAIILLLVLVAVAIAHF